LYRIPLRSGYYCAANEHTGNGNAISNGGKFTSNQSYHLYLKFSAQQIFDGYWFLPANSALVTTTAGTIVDIVSQADAGTDVQYWPGLLCPGFVNAHCHLELSHLRGQIPTQTGLVDFLAAVIQQRQATDAEKQAAMEAAHAAMLANGIVAVGDICNTTDTVSLKRNSPLHFHNFIEATGFVPETAAQRWEAALTTAASFALLLKPFSIVPHAPYSVSPQLLSHINRAAAGNIISLHNQETEAENEFFKTGTGAFINLYERLGIPISFFEPHGHSSLQAVWPQLNKPATVILVHNVATSPQDIQYLTNANAAWHPTAYMCLCPNANLYIGGSLPNVPLLEQSGLPIVLGTDSLASNTQLCLVNEMVTLQQNFPELSNATVLQWATSNGAFALDMQHRIGSLEVGKTPGIVGIGLCPQGKLTTQVAPRRLI
jgi:aminodeoxyfutalosine deaminase